MSNPYIPSTDSGFDNWFNNFQTVIAANPALYGLVAGDATNITNAYNLWHTLYLLAGTAPPHRTPINPGARTPVSIQNMVVNAAASKVLIRTYAAIIRGNAGVSDADRVAAGLNPANTSRTPIPAPGTSPIIGFIGSTPGQVTFNFKDTSTPTVKKKPFGAVGLEVWQSIGTAPPVAPEATDFVGIQTKSPFALTYNNADAGKTAYVYSRWITRRGLVGPWSTRLDVTVPAA